MDETTTLPAPCQVCGKPLKVPFCISTSKDLICCSGCVAKPKAQGAAPFRKIDSLTPAYLLAALRDADGSDEASSCIGLLGLILKQMNPDDPRRAEPGAVHTVLAALNKYPSVSLFQDLGMLTLIELVGSAERRDEAVAAGALSTVVQALQTHAGDAEVVVSAIQAACVLALAGTKETDEKISSKMQDATAAAGLIDLMLDVLPRHVDSLAAQEYGLFFLASMTSLNAGNAATAFSKGLVAHLAAVIPSALASNDADAAKKVISTILQVMCSTLQACESERSVVQKYASSCALLWFQQILAKHHADANISYLAMNALVRMVIGADTELLAQAAASNTFGLIRTTLREHAACAEVVEEALGAVSMLTMDNAANASLAATSGAKMWAVNALHSHATSASVVRVACYCISNTCSYVRDDVTVYPIIVTAVKVHGGSPSHALASLVTMNSLLKNHDDVRHAEAATAAGAVPLVINLLRKHPANADVQVGGALVLALLAPSERAHAEARSLGALPLLAEAAQVHARDTYAERVLELAQDALKRKAGPVEAALRSLASEAVQAAKESAMEQLKEYFISEEIAASVVQTVVEIAIGGCCTLM